MATFDEQWYREALLSADITPRQIMSEIDVPTTVFKYRRFGDLYLNASLQGQVFYSLPSKINANDDDDCVVSVDSEKCIKHIAKWQKNDRKLGEETAGKIYESLKTDWLKPSQEQNGLQNQVKIGCFTTVAPQTEAAKWMWQEFAGNDGYCIEYQVEPTLLYPGTIVFLPICYAEDDRYDDTAYVLRIFDYIRKHLSDENWDGCLPRSFVAQAYNHTLFKPRRYAQEQEWRVVVPRNRDKAYFDTLCSFGGIKNLQSCLKRIYVKSSGLNDMAIAEAEKVRIFSQQNNIACIDV